jgi:disulfide bond formation protein DsbB
MNASRIPFAPRTWGRSVWVALAAAGSAALLAGAMMFQALGYAPCPMCLWQRWPHVAAIAIGILAVFVPRRALLWLGALAAATSGAIGIYHTGVERAWWQGPTSCTSSGVSGVSADDLLNQIMAAPLVRCDEVAWQMLGLSMASWNVLASFALAGVWLYAASKRA